MLLFAFLHDTSHLFCQSYLGTEYQLFKMFLFHKYEKRIDTLFLHSVKLANFNIDFFFIFKYLTS